MSEGTQHPGVVKTRSAGSTYGNRRMSLRRRVALALLGATIAAMAASGSALAEDAPALIDSFDGADTPAGSMTPGRLAADEVTGDVYVMDTAHGVVNRFNSDGTYDNLQLSDPGFSFESPGGQSCDAIAVDNSAGSGQGNVYVNTIHAVYAFDGGGTLLWKVGFGAESCGLAVDSNGELWASWYGVGSQRLNTVSPVEPGDPQLGDPIGPAVYMTGAEGSIAFDEAGNIVMRDWGGSPLLKKFDRTGKFLGFYPTATGQDVAVDRLSGRVYAPSQESINAWTATGKLLVGAAGRLIHGAPFGSGGNSLTADAANHRLYVSRGSEVEVFDTLEYNLEIVTTGPGAGSFFCGGVPCESSYLHGKSITLTAGPHPGSFLSGWTVDGNAATCPGTGSCTFTLEADTTVEANFELIEHTLSLNKSGSGSGTVAIQPFGETCEASCSGEYVEGSYIVLMATPQPHLELQRLGRGMFREIDLLRDRKPERRYGSHGRLRSRRPAAVHRNRRIGKRLGQL